MIQIVFCHRMLQILCYKYGHDHRLEKLSIIVLQKRSQGAAYQHAIIPNSLFSLFMFNDIHWLACVTKTQRWRGFLDG